MKEIIAYALPFLLVTALQEACNRPQAKPPSIQAQSAQAGSAVQASASGGQAAQEAAPPSGPASAGAKVFSGEGVVEGVDKSIDTIQINHGDIKGYMPAMSMPYKVKDKSLLDLVKPGDKVSFTLEDAGNGPLLIELKKAAS